MCILYACALPIDCTEEDCFDLNYTLFIIINIYVYILYIALAFKILRIHTNTRNGIHLWLRYAAVDLVYGVCNV